MFHTMYYHNLDRSCHKICNHCSRDRWRDHIRRDLCYPEVQSALEKILLFRQILLRRLFRPPGSRFLFLVCEVVYLKIKNHLFLSL